MNKVTRTAPRLAMLGVILTLLTTSAVHAEPRCSQATMSGTYVTSGTGVVGAGTTGSAAYAALGKVTYDGRGGGQAVLTQSVGGTVLSGRAVRLDESRN